MVFCRLGGTYEVEGNTLTKVNEDMPDDMRLYRIADRMDRHNTKFYCKEYMEEGVRQYVRGLSPYEERIILDEMVKKGALVEV